MEYMAELQETQRSRAQTRKRRMREGRLLQPKSGVWAETGAVMQVGVGSASLGSFTKSSYPRAAGGPSGAGEGSV